MENVKTMKKFAFFMICIFHTFEQIRLMLVDILTTTWSLVKHNKFSFLFDYNKYFFHRKLYCNFNVIKNVFINILLFLYYIIITV